NGPEVWIWWQSPWRQFPFCLGGFELDSAGGSQNGSPIKFAAHAQQSARRQRKQPLQLLTKHAFTDEISRMPGSRTAGALAGAKLNSRRCQPAPSLWQRLRT